MSDDLMILLGLYPVSEPPGGVLIPLRHAPLLPVGAAGEQIVPNVLMLDDFTGSDREHDQSLMSKEHTPTCKTRTVFTGSAFVYVLS